MNNTGNSGDENHYWTLHPALKSARIAAWTWDFASSVFRWSENAGEILGLATENLPGAPTEFIELVHPAERTELSRRINDLVDGAAMEMFYEFRVLSSDATYRWIESRGRVATEGSRRTMSGTFIDVTERREVAEALKRNEAILRQGEALAGMGSWELDLKTNTVTGSVGWTGLLECASPMKDPFKFVSIHPDDVALIRARLETLIRGEPHPPLEYRIRRADGKLRYVTSYAQMLRDDGGQPARIIGTVLDITERRAGERALEVVSRDTAACVGTEFFQKLVESLALALQSKLVFVGQLADGASDGAHDSGVKRIRTAAAWLNGARLPSLEYDLVGTPCEQVVRGSLCQYANDVATNFPNAKVLSDHHIVSYIGAPIRGKDGAVLGLLAVMDDKPMPDSSVVRLVLSVNAARAGAEMERLAAERQVQEILDTIDDAIWSKPVDRGSLTFASRATSRIFGRELCDFQLDPNLWLSMVVPEDRELVRRAIDHAAASGVMDLEYRILRPDGSIRWVADRSHTIRDERGAPVRLVGVVADITDRKELARQLYQVQKMDSIGRLAGGVAHDFNNLLFVILGQADMALTSIDDPRTRKKIELIMQAADRAASLTRQLLAFSRNSQARRENFDLNALLRENELILRRLISEDVHFQLDTGPDSLSVFADVSQITQVVLNLVVNARDAVSPGGGISVLSSLVQLTGKERLLNGVALPGPYACINVTDTGTGIPTEIQNKMFEPFFTTKTMDKGTGMGLSLVHGIVTQSGGFIECRSTMGTGTTFLIYLPVAAPQAKRPASAALVNLRGTETILVVEDDAGVRDCLREALQDCGYGVITAENGEEGLRIWGKDPGSIDLVVTDLTMPRMGGLEMATQMRIARPSARIIFTSGYAADLGVNSGENFIQKPFLPKVALEQIRRVLGRK